MSDSMADQGQTARRSDAGASPAVTEQTPLVRKVAAALKHAWCPDSTVRPVL